MPLTIVGIVTPNNQRRWIDPKPGTPITLPTAEVLGVLDAVKYVEGGILMRATIINQDVIEAIEQNGSAVLFGIPEFEENSISPEVV